MRTPGRNDGREFFTPGTDLAQEHSYLWALAQLRNGHRMRRACWAKTPLSERKLYVELPRSKVSITMANGKRKEYRPSIDTVMFSSDWNFAIVE